MTLPLTGMLDKKIASSSHNYGSTYANLSNDEWDVILNELMNDIHARKWWWEVPVYVNAYATAAIMRDRGRARVTELEEK